MNSNTTTTTTTRTTLTLQDDSSPSLSSRKKRQRRCLISLVVLLSVVATLVTTMQPHDHRSSWFESSDQKSRVTPKALQSVLDISDMSTQRDVECTWYGDCIVYKKGSNESGFIIAPLLLSNDDDDDDQYNEKKQWEWNQARQQADLLRQQGGGQAQVVQHVYLGSPTSVQLNQENWNPPSTFSFSRFFNKNNTTISSNTLIVQPIRMPPRPRVTFTLATPVQAMRQLALQALHPVAFLNNLDAGIQSTIQLLQQGHLCARDFQVMIDSTGKLYHLHLARCFIHDRLGLLLQDTPMDVIADHLRSLQETARHATQDSNDEVRVTTETILSHIDTTSSNAARYCGWFKCFFAAENVSTSGYLVHAAQSNQDYWNVLAAWKLARNLTRDYGALHLLRGSPYRIQITQEIVQQLKHVPLQTENGGRLNSQQPLIVQHVWKAPPHQVIKFYQPFQAKYGQDTNATAIIDTLFARAVTTWPDVAARLVRQVDCTQQMIRNQALCVYDFQVLLDFTGNFYHFDIDRCLEPMPADYGKSPFDHAEALIVFLDQLAELAMQKVRLLG